jgi:hypothetical protein
LFESEGRPRLVTRILKSYWTYSVVAIIGLIVHLEAAMPVYTVPHRLFGWIPLLSLLYFLWQYANQSFKSFPVLVLVTFQFYLFYGLPQFSQEAVYLIRGPYTPSEEAVTTATVLVVSGEILFVAAYLLTARVSRNASAYMYRRLPSPKPGWGSVIVPYTAVGLAVYSLVALRPEYIPVSIRFTLSQLLNVYLGLAVILYIGYVHARRRYRILGYFIAGTMAVVSFIQGMLSGMIGPLFVLFLFKWMWGGGIRLRWVFLILLGAIILNPVKNEYRNIAWYDKDVASLASIEQRVGYWAEAFRKVWLYSATADPIIDSTASRTSDLIPFAQAVDYVPAIIPYESGAAMESALFFWIPRVFWPDKGNTSDLLYNRYAIEFGYGTSETILSTTVGASIFTEGYWNFGTPGVLVFLFLAGSLCGLLFGNNGRYEHTSTLVCVTYVASGLFIVQALTIMISSLFSFLAGVVLALSGIDFSSKTIGVAVHRNSHQTTKTGESR